MFILKTILIFLMLITASALAAELTIELQKLNSPSESEQYFCPKIEEDLKAIDAFNHDSSPNGPSFKSRELALKTLDVLAKSDLGFSTNTSKAYQLLADEKNWPNDNHFLGELGKINPECALFKKHDIFWAYSLDHKRLAFSEADHKRFKEQFKIYVDSGLKTPGPIISLLVRANDLYHFSKAKIVGKPDDFSKVESLKNEMELEMQKHQKSLKERKTGSWSLKQEIELSKTYMTKFKALYSTMK